MKRKIFAIIIAVAFSALLMNITWIIYEDQYLKDKKADNDISENTIPTPDEVNLTMNISSRGLTNYSNKFSIDGAPENSNISWYMDGELIGYDNIKNYHFMEAGSFVLTSMISWGSFQQELTEQLRIERVDDRGSFELIYPWYWPIDVDPWMRVITSVKPGLTEPILWVNISLSISNSLVKFWIELMEDDKMEVFETLIYEVIPLGQMNINRSYFFDQDFFEQREEHEIYLFLIRLEIFDPDNAIIDGEISYEMIYGS